MKIYTANTSIFSSIDTEEKAYWLGFLIADGHNGSKEIRIDIKDEGHLEKLRDLIYPLKDKPIFIRDNGYGPIYCLSISRKAIVSDLNKYGVLPKKSKISYFPQIPNSLKLSFIRGVFDGDGSLNFSFEKNKGTYKRYTFSIVGGEDLIKSIHDFFKSQELGTTFRTHKTIFEVYVRGNKKILELLNHLYKDSNVFLQRKYDKYLEFSDYCGTRRVKNINN